jgi:hypothetical protein
MTNTHCRIGKITPKLSIIEPRKRGQFREKMHEHVNGICDILNGEIAGFYIVGIHFDGKYSRGWQLDEGANFGDTMFLSACKESITRTIGELAARDIIMEGC